MKKGDIIWGLLLIAISAFLIIPATNTVFVDITGRYPYLMGFIKFSIMATMGELLALRIRAGKWAKTKGMFFKAVIWGIIGMLIVLMFGVYSNGVAGVIKAGLLFSASGIFSDILTALLISSIMNLTFAPVFMAAHRISDTYIDLMVEKQKTSISAVINKTDWPGFIKFVIGKTIPFFWIPAHTIDFLLPPVYRIIVAAYLSIALGVILSYAKKNQR